MATNRPQVSIIIPAFNEEEVLPQFHRELCRVLDELTDEHDFEIVYVDDGSSDRTLGLMRHWAMRDLRVRYLSLSRNFGHQAAFAAGLQHAHGEAVVMMDCDLQHPPALLPTLLDRWQEGHDLVITLRKSRRAGAVRNLASRFFVGLLRRMSCQPMRPEMLDYCLLSRRAADSLLRLRESHRYLRGMLQWLGYSTAEVAFDPPPRAAGTSRFTFGRLLSFSLDAITSSSRLPLHLAFVVGMVFLLIGIGTVLRGVLGYIVPGWEVNGWMIALLASVHIVGGSILCGLGIIGEYIGRTFEQVKGRPIYLIKETEKALAEMKASRVASCAVPEPVRA
jgi:dolichol-phosphate mannosyltransferase